MDKIQKINYPSFFKIMMGDFSTRLGVPPAFENNFNTMNLRRNFTVSLKFVVEEGISWKVKLEKNSDGFYDFTRGWSKIVKDLQLEQGDFLVFYLVEHYTFQLAVYDPTSRLKTLNINPTTSERFFTVDNEKNAEVKTTPREKKITEEKEVESKNKSYTVKYTKPASRRYFCILPEWFGEEIHKECNEDEEVMLKDDEGREWVMNLRHRVQPTYRRYELITGWTNFCKGNNVVVGDKFKFEHIRGSTIAVSVLHHK